MAEGEFEARVQAVLAGWNAGYAAAGTTCASPLLDRALAERAVAEELYGDTPECRVCGCTDEWGCLVDVVDERTGRTELGPCEWVEADLCSACAAEFRPVAAVEVKAPVL